MPRNPLSEDFGWCEHSRVVPTIASRLPHYEAACPRFGRSFGTESGTTMVTAHEVATVAAVAKRMIAPHRPLCGKLNLDPKQWKEDAARKVDAARAAADVTARRQKRRQPSLPVPQLWSDDELEENFVRGSGSGGQKINKTSCCVLITVCHLHTDVSAASTDCSSRADTHCDATYAGCTRSTFQLVSRCAASNPDHSTRIDALAAKCCNRS